MRGYRKQRKGRRVRPAFLGYHIDYCDYCAGAAGAGAGAGAGSAGLLASGAAGFIVWSDAGGLVLCVVVVSVPLSLQAATPSKASAETDARMSFFMISLL